MNFNKKEKATLICLLSLMIGCLFLAGFGLGGAVKCEAPEDSVEWSINWRKAIACEPEEYYILYGPDEKIWFRCDASTQTILEVGRYRYND